MSSILYDNSTSISQHFSENQAVQYDPEIAPIIIALDLRTPPNIGGIIRLAGNLGCRKVIFTGDENHFRLNKIRKAATTGFGQVDWSFCEHGKWTDEIPDNYQIVAVETVKEATSIFNTQLIGKYAFVVGNERYGIDTESIKACESAVYIPMPGVVKSMNVVQATNVILFEWLRQNITTSK